MTGETDAIKSSNSIVDANGLGWRVGILDIGRSGGGVSCNDRDVLDVGVDQRLILTQLPSRHRPSPRHRTTCVTFGARLHHLDHWRCCA